MRGSSLEVLGCPRCHAPLDFIGEASEQVETGHLACRAEGLVYPVVGGIPRLVVPERAASAVEFGTSFSNAWRQEGWGACDAGYLTALPWNDTSGKHSSEWRVKARSMTALLELVADLRPKRIVDLGCGVGWLSHRLAVEGYEVFAIDLVLDDTLGLGAAGFYLRNSPYFERIWGELDRPPVRDESVDALICNASLHYAPSLTGALAEIARVLSPGGLFVVLNSPVHKDAKSALRAQSDFRDQLRSRGTAREIFLTYHHFARHSLEAAIREAVGPVRERQFDPGRGFRFIRRLKGVALGMELASFPLLYATKQA